MTARVRRTRGPMLLLAAGLLGIVAVAGATGGEQPQPLERVATISLKGASGSLDHVFVDTKHSRLFLANQSNDTLDIVDLRKNALLRQIGDQKEIHGVAYAADLDRLFVGAGGGVCNAFAGRDFTLLKSIPVKYADNVHYDPRTNHVFVAGEKDMIVIDAKSLEVLTAIPLGGSPEGFQIATEQPRLYVNVGPNWQVAVIDTSKNEVIARYPLKATKGLETLVLDERNKRIFLGFRAEPRIVVLEQDSDKEVASVVIPDGIDDMFFDREAKQIYASCASGSIAVVRQVDADHYEPVANVPTIKGAKTCCFDSGTKRVYLAVPRQAGKEGPEIWVYQAKG
jgi:hypothetical protein